MKERKKKMETLSRLNDLILWRLRNKVKSDLWISGMTSGYVHIHNPFSKIPRPKCVSKFSSILDVRRVIMVWKSNITVYPQQGLVQYHVIKHSTISAARHIPPNETDNK